jgi:hypothetical protein
VKKSQAGDQESTRDGAQQQHKHVACQMCIELNILIAQERDRRIIIILLSIYFLLRE